MAEKYGFKEQMIYICHNMGNAFTYSGDINSFRFYSLQAQDYYRQSFHQAVDIGSWEVGLTEYACLMGSILSEGNFADAAEDIQRFKQLKWPDSIPGYSYARALTEGTALMNKGRRVAALAQFSRLPAYSHTSGIPHEGLFKECALIGLARLYHQMGDKEQLEACLRTMQRTAHDEVDVNLKLYALRYRYLLCKQTGDKAQANAVKMEYIQISDSDLSRGRKLFDSQRGYYAQLDNISTLARTQHHGPKANTVVALLLMAFGLGVLCVVLWRKRTTPASKSEKYAGSRLTPEEKKLLAETQGFETKFDEAMDDDFNTADALAAIFELVKFVNSNAKADSSKEFLEALKQEIVTLSDICGLIVDKKAEMLDSDIEALIEERQAARKAKNFARADEIRDELLAKGIVLEDTREGVKWKRA